MSDDHPAAVRSARDRLRDQQRLESERLAAVLAAERRLHAQLAKAEAVERKEHEAVAAKQRDVDDAVLGLIEISGLTRAAALLGQSAQAVAVTARKRRREVQTHESHAGTTRG